MTGTERRAVVVEDDDDIRQLITHSLGMQGFAVAVARSGREAIDLVTSTDPDLVTLDLGLPDLDGIEVCRRVRETSQAYIIMISARTEEIDRLMGLETGADDYLTKPFSPRELQVRVNALLRRPRTSWDPSAGATGPIPVVGTNGTNGANGVHGAGAPDPTAHPITNGHDAGLAGPAGHTARGHRSDAGDADPVVRHGLLAVDTESRTVTVDETEVELTRTEFDLLTTMLAAPRRVWSRAVLLDTLWGAGWSSEEHLVEVHVGNLRRKLTRAAPEGSRPLIRTVRGVGYRMEEPDAL
ncbi:response regulator transcription factor [Intrasporangium sp. YIM S08009]|uniref:response regulator transcription factor n=1 Tax=Intrasporangium zincisolvens TaxID=3080018 RepID=UPI002B05E34A|nr:response regulator transcription factor [Intrasporangium sp. YIM S08009]